MYLSIVVASFHSQNIRSTQFTSVSAFFTLRTLDLHDSPQFQLPFTLRTLDLHDSSLSFLSLSEHQICTIHHFRLGQFSKECQIKNSQIITRALMELRIQIAKFKFRRYILRVNSLNLMLAKLSCCTVVHTRKHFSYQLLSQIVFRTCRCIPNQCMYLW